MRVVELLEKKGKGLNLPKEVRDGNLKPPDTKPRHAGGACGPSLRYKIAYINHDIDDAIRARILTEEELRGSTRYPWDTAREGASQHHDPGHHFQQSLGKPQILGVPGHGDGHEGLRTWMFAHVYRGGAAKARRRARPSSSSWRSTSII